MITSHENEVERWLGQVCEQIKFSQVRLAYVPHTGQAATEKVWRIDQASTHQPHLLNNYLSVAWQTTIHSSSGKLGQLQVHSSPSEPLQTEFLHACALADQLAQMASNYSDLLGTLHLELQKPKLTRKSLEQGALRHSIEELLSILIQKTGSQGAAFFLLDETGCRLNLKYYLHEALSPVTTVQRELTSAAPDLEALRNGVAICCRNFSEEAVWLPEQAKTGIAVRVGQAGSELGTLWLYDQRIRSLKNQELSILQSQATQLAGILEQAVTVWSSANHRRMQRELKLAAATQPAHVISYQDHDGRLEAAGKCLSQFDVGGDLCEVVRLDADSVFVVVGDASGNSLPAAMVMTAVRGAIYALLAERSEEAAATDNPQSVSTFEPARFMQKLNRMLTRMTSSCQFMSCICGIFYLARQEFVFCNAGHPQPIHLSGNKIESLPSHGLLLGMDESVRYQQGQVSFTSGDVFVFYSDGVSEAQNASRHLFHQNKIAEVARQEIHQPASQITHAIWTRMLTHQSGSGKSADATILAVKLNK